MKTAGGALRDAAHNIAALLAPCFIKVTTLCADLVCRISHTLETICLKYRVSLFRFSRDVQSL